MRSDQGQLRRRGRAKHRPADVVLLRLFVLALALLPTVGLAQPTITTIKSSGNLGIADQNVALAIQFLKQHGDPGIAAKLEAHIAKGKVRWASSGGDAETDGSGVIVLPPHRVGIGAAGKQVFDPIEGSGEIYVLAITLVHELVHAEQHSGLLGLCPERRASNYWGDRIGFRPHEIEGWTKGLQGGLRWLRSALAEYSKIVDGSARHDAIRRIELMVQALKTMLSDFKSHNYYGSGGGAKWQALVSDLGALEAALKSDADATRQRSQRKRCFDQCGMLARLADELRIRVGEAEAGLQAAQKKFESIANSHAHVDREIQKHREDIERSDEKLSRNLSDEARGIVEGIMKQAFNKLAAAERRKAGLPSLESAEAELAAAQTHFDKKSAEHQAARAKWRACMQQCLQDLMFSLTGTRTEYPASALPPGFGVEGNQVVYDPKYQRDLTHRFTFDMQKWKSVLDSRVAKLPTEIQGDELPCPETTAQTGIKVQVVDVFGENGYQEKGTNGVVISVTGAESVQKARVVTGTDEEHDLIALKPGSYTLTLDIGRYLPAIPESCTEGYKREFTLKTGEQLEFTAIVYTTNVARSGLSAAPQRGDCIRLVSPR